MWLLLPCDFVTENDLFKDQRNIPVNAVSLPSEDQSRGGPREVRRELPPEGVQRERQRADTAAGSKWEQWLDEAHPHHCRNNDVSALCERNQDDVLFFIISAFYLICSQV